LFVASSVAAGLCAWFVRLGHYAERHLFHSELAEIVNACIIGLLISGFVEFASKSNFSRLWLVLSWMCAAVTIPFGRVATRSILNVFGAWQVNAVIMGNGVHSTDVKDSLSRDKYFGYRLASDVGIALYADPSKSSDQALDKLLRETKAQCIILVPAADEMPYLANVINSLNVRMVSYKIVPPIERLPLAGLTTQSFLNCDAMLMTVQVGLASPLNQAIKRLVDISASALLLILTSPLLLAVSLAVAADGGPVFYGHERVGCRGRTFRCWKFRTMVPNAAEMLGNLLANSPNARREWSATRKLREDPRNTKLGGALRSWSIDELPQLFNVFRGEMSLVGPRPVVKNELFEHYKSDYSYYLLVRPGVTGLWQTSGRNNVSYEKRVHLDAWYVRNWSLWGDLMILARTLPAVIAKDGAY
jgi:Undecaprenyl-phosphate galactose phosphotransferase WbaP